MHHYPTQSSPAVQSICSSTFNIPTPPSSSSVETDPATSSQPDTAPIWIRPILLLSIGPEGARRAKGILHVLEVGDLHVLVDLGPSRPGGGDGLLHDVGGDLELAPGSDIAPAIAEDGVDRERAAGPPETDTCEGVQEGLVAHPVACPRPRHDLMQVRVVHGERDVGGVQGDALLDEVRVWVGLGVENLEEDVHRGAGEVGGPDHRGTGVALVEVGCVFFVGRRSMGYGGGQGRPDEEQA